MIFVHIQKERNMSVNFMHLKTIAYIKTSFPEKFGIPRQSGLVDTIAEIHFLPEYSDPSSIRGLEEYSHLWLIWGLWFRIGTAKFGADKFA